MKMNMNKNEMTEPMVEEGSENELNPTNPFGEILLDMIEGQYKGDIDAGIMAIMETTGLEEAVVVQIIKGEGIVEEPELLEAIIEAFPDASDDDIEMLIEVAAGVEEATRDEMAEEYEAKDTEGSTGGTKQVEPQAQYKKNMTNQAQFNKQVTDTINALVQENAALKAEFNKNYAVGNLSDRLADIDNRLETAVINHVLPPAVKASLIGSFTNPMQRVAQFSAIASKNGARDAQEHLYATEYALSFLENLANVVEFHDYSTSEDEAAMAHFSANLETVAAKDLEAIGFDYSRYVA